TAYFLAGKGKDVVLIVHGIICSGETVRTTVHISNALDDRHYNIANDLNEENAKLAAQSHTLAIEIIETIVLKEKINCDFSRLDGYLFIQPSDEKDNLDKEYEAARKAGIIVQVVSEIPGIVNVKGPYLKFQDQAQFHPMKYLKGLAKCIVSNNGRIFTQTHAQEITSDKIQTSDGFTINAKHIVVATNTPVINTFVMRSEEHTSELQSRENLVCRLLLEK